MATLVALDALGAARRAARGRLAAVILLTAVPIASESQDRESTR